MIEWKKLGEVCTFNRGRTITAKDAENGEIPVIAGGQAPSYYHNEANRNGESITVAGSGAYAGFISYWNQPIFVSDAFTVDPNRELGHRYLFYWLKMNQTNVFAMQKGAGVPHVHGKDIANFIIPIPSLAEQQRIVGILDTFTASIDNLKEQIAQRRKQYEYYRDQLLDLEGKEGVEMKTLGEVCEVTDYVANGSFASLRENVEYKQEPDYAILVRTVDLSNNFKGDKIYIDERAYKFLSKTALYGGEIIINNIGVGVGQTFMCPYLDEKMSLGPNSIMVRTSNNHFFYYWFNSTYGQNSIMKVVTPGAMPKFNKTGFKTILAPLPSLSEQQRIVSILDTFEASIQNLEAQLSQREKQYEYYRNKLLTFE